MEEEEPSNIMNIDNKITDNADAKTTHDAGEVVDKNITSELIIVETYVENIIEEVELIEPSSPKSSSSFNSTVAVTGLLKLKATTNNDINVTQLPAIVEEEEIPTTNKVTTPTRKNIINNAINEFVTTLSNVDELVNTINTSLENGLKNYINQIQNINTEQINIISLSEVFSKLYNILKGDNIKL